MGVFSNIQDISNDVNVITNLAQTVFSTANQEQIEQFVLEFQKLRNSQAAIATDTAQAQATAASMQRTGLLGFLDSWRNVLCWFLMLDIVVHYGLSTVVIPIANVLGYHPVVQLGDVASITTLFYGLLGLSGLHAAESVSRNLKK